MQRYSFSAEQRSLLEGLAQPFAIYQFVGKRVVTLALSDGFCELFGYDDRAQAYYDMDNDMYKDTHPDDVARIAEVAFRFAVDGGTYEVVYRTKKPHSADYHVIHAIGKHVFTETGERLAHVWYTDEGDYLEDAEGEISQLNGMLSNALHEESIMRANCYDYLTGLPNMTYFFELAAAGKEAIVEDGGIPAMLYMDLNGMKFFNTQNSFAEGDNLLREFAKVLRSVFSTENCCRIGSDHFAAFTKTEGLEDALERLFEGFRTANGGNSLPVRVGIYRGGGEDMHISVACDRAKLACDAVRDTYQSCYSYYDPALHDAEERRRYVLSNLDQAIEQGWIQVYYQPIVRAVNGRVCDEEALSRWIDPNVGFLSPAEFIPALEGAGTIYKLDLYVLDQVLMKMKRQEEAGFDIVPHSINLSRSDFVACDIVEEVLARVDAAGIRRDMITVEVTESTVGRDFEFMKKQVERFRELGFPVWMDDFGSGYSSMDVLQSITFDLIKFDMSFMQKLDEGDSGKIVLTELMRMATALGVGTVCEGVETAEQVQFLQEIGCAKLQGFHYCRPISQGDIFERYEKGVQIGYENPEESSYFEAIGRVSLYDLSVIAGDDDGASAGTEEDGFQNYFNTLPMGIMEVCGDDVRFVRTNQSYRDFMLRFFGFDVLVQDSGYSAAPFGVGSTFMQLVRQCCEKGGRAFFDETMPDGSIVHSFARRVGTNPVTGASAAAIAVLSITEANEGATYASIARALAADYYNIYYVDLDTENFIEYSSTVGGDELAMERHGERFFESASRDTMTRIYEGDRDQFLARFTKENVVRELDEQGVFSATYRLIDDGEPMYVSMKVTRLRAGGSQIIVGISIVDSQMKQKELFAKLQREQDVLRRVTALSGDYQIVYSIDPETGKYFECSVSDEFERMGFAKEGENFFSQALVDASRTLCPDDLPAFREWIDKERILRELDEHGATSIQYRLKVGGGLKPVILRIAKVREGSGDCLVAGVRAWKQRRSEWM